MLRQVAIVFVAWFLSVAVLRPQPPSSPADQTDHPSNGVLEMTLAPVFPQVLAPPPREPGRPLVDGPWRGEVLVTLKNISRYKVRCLRRDWWLVYEVKVLDSDGKPAPLTPFGEGEFAPRTGPPGYSGPIAETDLEPGQELTDHLALADIFQLKRGSAYTVKITRSRGLPQADFLGRPLAELSATLVVEADPGGRGN